MNKNDKINNYIQQGFGDLYFGLISFIGKYVNKNYNPFDGFSLDGSKQTDYAFALDFLKQKVFELIDYLGTCEEVFIPELNKNITLSTMSFKEFKSLETRCKEALIDSLDRVESQRKMASSQKNR